MNISLSDDMHAYVEKRVKKGKFDNKSEYIRSLIRDELDKLYEQDLERKLQEGLDDIKAGRVIPVDEKFWEDLNKEFTKIIEEHKG